ncbi:branched-chain amino acid transport system substrate-binding protein [Rhodoligotrophos appendicifer]|uniref:ABC transporter substrate-binding protein n=1 Tax=Rhodoligotrophos appendicifer TaxID=987056 RepID=UPI001185CDB5|nr:ABC transporter substrate-binding protein [Rhodoligotrophos appendicifer]
MKKSLRLLLLGLAGAVLSAGPVLSAEIPIGLMHALTGNVGFVGTTMANGAILGAEEINKNKVLGDDTIKLIVEDTASDRNQAMNLVTKLATADKALMIVGPTSSIESLASAPVANEQGIPLYTLALSSDIFKSGPWAFKGLVGTSAYMKPVGEYIVGTLKPKRVAIIFDRQNDSTVTQKKFLKEDLEKNGIEIVSENGILGTDTDFSVIATQVVGEKPDAVFVAAQAHVGANVLAQLRQAGLPKETQLIGSMNMAAPTLIKLGGDAVEGTLLVGDFAPDGSTNQESKDFVAAYTARFGTAPDNFAAGGYAQMKVVGTILKELGPNPTREQVRDKLTSAVKNVPVVLGTGSYSIGEGRQVEYTPVLLKVEGGKFVGVK